MADLIPPVPNEDFQRPYPWWDWFRKIRKNINEFAASISAIVAELVTIVTQITAVNAYGSGSVSGGQTWTTASSFSTSEANIFTITTTGSSVTLNGAVTVTGFTTGGTTCHGMSLSILVKRDSTNLDNMGVIISPIQYTTPTSWGDTCLGFTFRDSPAAGTYTYKLVCSIQTLDNTGSATNTSGEIYYKYLFTARENKT